MNNTHPGGRRTKAPIEELKPPYFSWRKAIIEAKDVEEIRGLAYALVVSLERCDEEMGEARNVWLPMEKLTAIGDKCVRSAYREEAAG